MIQKFIILIGLICVSLSILLSKEYLMVVGILLFFVSIIGDNKDYEKNDRKH